MSAWKKKYRIFMIGWEYPPHITGGLAVACRGLAGALGRLGHEVLLMLPRVHGDEPVDKGVDVFDFHSKAKLLSRRERRRLRRRIRTLRPIQTELSLPVLAGSPELPAYFSKDFPRPAELRLPVTEHVEESVDVLVDVETKGEGVDTKGYARLKGGYGERLYQEVHRYAEYASILAEKMDFDVIHAHDWITYPAALAVAHSTGRPLVCHVHATEFDRSGAHVNQYVYDLERKALHECDAAIPVSHYTGGILRDRYAVHPGKIHAVHNGADLGDADEKPLVRERKPFGEKVVLFLGRITHQKGPEYFVQAAKRVVDEYRNVRFVMAGKGDLFTRMVEMTAEMGIGRYFHYTGFVNREQVRRLYRMSDIFLMPSVSEPFGLTALEAMVEGVPVIVSRQSGVSEVVSACVNVDFWDVAALSNSMLRILRDEPLALSMKKRARAEVRHVTWGRAADAVAGVYGRLLPTEAS